MTSTVGALPGVSEEEAGRLANMGIQGWDDLVDVDPLAVADALALPTDLLVALVAEARQRVSVGRPASSMEAIDRPDDEGFVEVPSSAKRDRGARVSARVHAVREALRKARRRAKRADAGRRTVRSLKRSRARLRKLAEELESQGASRRRVEAVEVVVERVEDAVARFVDGKPTPRRAKRLRRRVRAALERLE